MWLIHGCCGKERALLLFTSKSTFHQGVNPGVSESESLSRRTVKLPPETTPMLLPFFFSFFLVYVLCQMLNHLQNKFSLNWFKKSLLTHQALLFVFNLFSLVEERKYMIMLHKQFATQSSAFWDKYAKWCNETPCLWLSYEFTNKNREQSCTLKMMLQRTGFERRWMFT